jgi:hypothetical protein
MDTITVIINGKIMNSNHEDLVAGSIELKNNNSLFKVNSDTLGKFQFSHIPAGKYSVSAQYVGHRPLENDSIVLVAGDIIKMEIEMGHVGQDDLKKKRN